MFVPNPTNSIIYIKGQFISSEMLVTLYSVDGKQIEIASSYENEKSISVDLNSLVNGVYFIKISEGGQSIVKRVVKH